MVGRVKGWGIGNGKNGDASSEFDEKPKMAFKWGKTVSEYPCYFLIAVRRVLLIKGKGWIGSGVVICWAGAVCAVVVIGLVLRRG